MDFIASGRQTGGQPFRELRCAVDFGSIGLCRDENATWWGVTVCGQNSTLLGVGQLVAATSDSALVFTIFDIGMITRQYNDAQTGAQSGSCDHQYKPERSRCGFAEDDGAEDDGPDWVDDGQPGDDHLRRTGGIGVLDEP